MVVVPPVAHLCLDAYHGDVRIVCDGTWTTAAWGSEATATGIEGVYKAEDGRCYTFDRESTTCEKCLAATP